MLLKMAGSLSCFMAGHCSVVYTYHTFFVCSFVCGHFLKVIYLFLVVLGCCLWAFSGCGAQGLLLTAVHWLLCGGFSCWGAQALGAWASVAVVCGWALLHTGFSHCDAGA